MKSQKTLLIYAKIMRQMIDQLEDNPGWGPGSAGRIVGLKSALAIFLQHIEKMKEGL